jgi:hypothetical protein
VHCCDFMLCRFKRVHIIYQNCMLQKIYSKHGLVEQIQHELHLATDDAKEQNIYPCILQVKAMEKSGERGAKVFF